MIKKIFAVCMLCSTGIGIANADTNTTVLTPSQKKVVHHIEESLSQTKTFQARFRQTGVASGKMDTGTVVVSRPGRLHFTYDPPSPLSVVANDGKVVFQDTSIDQVTTLPLDRTPLGLLLRPDPHFSGDVTVTGFQEKKGEIELKAVRTDNPSEGELTLHFRSSPLGLEGWDIVDSQGRQTNINLSKVKTDVVVNPKLFSLPKDE